MTRVDSVTAENMSVEDSSKIAVWGTVADVSWQCDVYHACAVHNFTVSVKPVHPSTSAYCSILG